MMLTDYLIDCDTIQHININKVSKNDRLCIGVSENIYFHALVYVKPVCSTGTLIGSSC